MVLIYLSFFISSIYFILLGCLSCRVLFNENIKIKKNYYELALIGIITASILPFLLNFFINLNRYLNDLLFILPFVVVFFSNKIKKELDFQKIIYISLIIALIVPVVAYVGFIGLFFSFDTNLKIIERFGLLKYNFQDFQFSIESVISFVLVIGLSLYLYLRLRTLKMNRVEGAFKKAFFITLVINSILVFGMAYAREARLFALPLFFAWPILTNLLLSESFEWKIGFDFRSGVFLTLVLGAGVIAYYSAIHYYDPVIGSGAGGYFHLYFSFLIGFVIFDLLFKKVKV